MINIKMSLNRLCTAKHSGSFNFILIRLIIIEKNKIIDKVV